VAKGSILVRLEVKETFPARSEAKVTFLDKLVEREVIPEV
jgi:hypothetical protein